MSAKPRIAVVEDQARYRRVLVQFLDGQPGWRVVAECANAEEALRTIPLAKPNLILLDLLLPGSSGIDLIAKLKSSLPLVPIVMLTVVDNPDEIVRALEAGACGYILKGDTEQGLLVDVKEVLAGGATMSPAVARRLVNWFQQRQSDRKQDSFNLSEREWEVLRLASRGKQHGEIAMALGIAVNTVKNHFRNIYEKLDVHTLNEALIKINKGRDLLGGR